MFLNNMKGCAIKANLLKSVGVLLLFAVIVKIVMLVVNQKKEDKKGNVLSKLGITGSPNGISYSNCGLK